MHFCQGVIDSKVRLCGGPGEKKKLNHSSRPTILPKIDFQCRYLPTYIYKTIAQISFLPNFLLMRK